MPFRSASPIIKVELESMHTIDTRNVENLFGLWSVFSKCSETMEDGKRLENLSWRLWNRETFCCAPDQQASFSPRRTFARRQPTQSPTETPELSSSVESDSSSIDAPMASLTLSGSAPARPELRNLDSANSRRRGKEKHITPFDLEKMVTSIKDKKELEPLSPLPASIFLQPHSHPPVEDTTPRPSSPPPRSVPDSSTSTVATACDSADMSPPADSDASTSTDLSAHSVVRGFELGRISSSPRSVPQPKDRLAPMPNPILKNSQQQKMEQSKKKGAIFTLGGSSGEGDDSSLEIRYMAKSSLSDGLKKAGSKKKQTSFKDEVTTQMIQEKAYESEQVFESDSEEEEVDSSAIEDDEDDPDWEDDEDEDTSKLSSLNEDLFQRVDSRPNLTSRRSLLTNLLHEKDRAAALQNAASRSTPAIRRSRTSSPNGPSLVTSPKNAPPMPTIDAPGAKPILTTSNYIPIPPALSPRTTRRNMLTSELTESLRKHLLWERQQKNSTSSAALKRRHTSHDVKNLTKYPKPQQVPINEKGMNSWNHYFDNGLQEYHERGW